MSRKKRQKRRLPGHYCWACDRRQPNEKFSGRGHARHLCRDCELKQNCTNPGENPIVSPILSKYRFEQIPTALAHGGRQGR